MQEKEHLGGCAYERLFVLFQLEAHGKGVDRMAKRSRVRCMRYIRLPLSVEAGLQEVLLKDDWEKKWLTKKTEGEVG